MYSLVLMTAMSTAPATPQFDGYFRDLFRGSSCQGSCSGRDSSRSGSGTSCQGSCHGSCQGGLFHGRIRNFFADLFDGRGSCNGCTGCHGGCNGRPRDPLPIARSPVGGCTGDRYAGGCTGGIAYGGCTGSTPLYLGSCFGSTPMYSCFGSCMGGGSTLPPLNVPLPSGEFATPQPVGFGVSGCDCQPGAPGVPGFGTPLPLGTLPNDYPTITPPNVPAVPRTMPDDPFSNPAQPRPAEGGSSVYKQPMDDAARGRVTVTLPTDARLFVEGRQMSVTDGERTFVTPPLPADREAVYAFKVEYVRNGETLSQSRKVRVRAGGNARVDFVDLTMLTKADRSDELPAVPTVPAEETKSPPALPPVPGFNAQTTNKPADTVPTVTPPPGLDVARITVKLPPGATLYVNGGKNERTEPVREFTTPTLKPGKVYQYTMRAERTRNGLPEYQESKVEFRAGDSLTVDFTSLDDRRAAK